MNPVFARSVDCISKILSILDVSIAAKPNTSFLAFKSKLWNAKFVANNISANTALFQKTLPCPIFLSIAIFYFVLLTTETGLIVARDYHFAIVHCKRHFRIRCIAHHNPNAYHLSIPQHIFDLRSKYTFPRLSAFRFHKFLRTPLHQSIRTGLCHGGDYLPIALRTYLRRARCQYLYRLLFLLLLGLDKQKSFLSEPSTEVALFSSSEESPSHFLTFSNCPTSCGS